MKIFETLRQCLKIELLVLHCNTRKHLPVRVCVGIYIVFLGLISIFVVVYLIYFYMWLHILTSRKVAIYSDGDDIIIITIIIVGFLV